MASTPAERAAFTQGVAATLACMIRDHGETCLAEYVMDGFGYTPADFRAAKVERYDLAPILKLWKELGRPTSPPKTDR